MLLDGLDSAYAPTLQQAQEARSQGYVWWGFYLPKLPNTDPLNGWTVAQMDVLKQAGIVPVPICVPAPPHPADPVQLANEYVALAQQYGLNPTIAICYNGEHITASGPVWLPVPGSKPTAVGAGSAIQWGQGTIEGLSVDYNTAAADFPAASGLVCDLEHNAAYTSDWYRTFQQTVISLNTGIDIEGIETRMLMYRHIGPDPQAVSLLAFGKWIPIGDDNDRAAMQAAGVGLATVSDGFWNTLSTVFAIKS